jgi:hypothetical protein
VKRSQWIGLGIAGAVLTLAVLPASATHHEASEQAKPAAAGERAPWDQARMTELSDQLATAMSELRRAFRREPGFRDPSSPNRRATQSMDQTLRLLEQSARQLRNRVSGGAGFEETRNIARKIGSLLNDADVEGRRIMTSVWLDERIRPAMKLINEIAPYYGSGPLYDPETLQKLDRPPNPDRRVPAE